MGKKQKLYRLNSQKERWYPKITYISNVITEKTDSYLEVSIFAEIMQHYIKLISKNNEKIARLYHL